MKNAFIFHGTEGSPEGNWFPWLKAALDQRGLFTLVPQFPTPENQTLANWLHVMEPHLALCNEHTIFIGHSVGGIFALRLLEQLSAPIHAAFLIGTPIGIDEIKGIELSREKLFLHMPLDWQKIRMHSQNFHVYHSDDDPYVSLDNGTALAENLDVKLNFIPGCGHFNAESGFTEFPQLLADIINVSAIATGLQSE